MNKYILKKDLPFAKAGNEVKINDYNIKVVSNAGAPFLYHEYLAKYFDGLISQGWIEEVKPREFTLCFQGKRFCGISENGQELWHNDLNMDNCIAIKVREVIV